MTWEDLENKIKEMSKDEKQKEVTLVIKDQPGHAIVGKDVELGRDINLFLVAYTQV